MADCEHSACSLPASIQPFQVKQPPGTTLTEPLRAVKKMDASRLIGPASTCKHRWPANAQVIQFIG